MSKRHIRSIGYAFILALIVAPFQNCSKFTGSHVDESASESADDTGSTSGPGFKPIRIGAGGYVTGMDISPDGSTHVVRTDTYGAYIRNGNEWEQLVTSTRMPVAAQDMSGGVQEIRVAPSMPNRIYMMYIGYLYRSDNRGKNFVQTGFAKVTFNANDTYRTFGQKMAVDPVNPNVVYAGTPLNGLFVTENAGASWQSVASIPAGTGAGVSGIVFDPTSGTMSGKTKRIFVTSSGSGVFKSEDAGSTWTALTGGPTSTRVAKLASDGIYYATDLGQKVWRFQNSIWTDITPTGQTFSVVVVDPFDAARVVLIRAGGAPNYSRDRGATWSGMIWGATRVSPDIPWHAWTNENYMSEGDLLFDPLVPNKLWFAQGIGVWTTNFTNDLKTNLSTIFWTSQSRGIEQLVANQVLAPPGGKPVVASWDRPIFYVENPDVYPSTHGPGNAESIQMAWSLDYASSNPSFLVSAINWTTEKSGFSVDGGKTWQPFPSYPPLFSNGKRGGHIAASTPQNFVWIPSNNGVPYYTLNGGTTWTQAIMPGAPTVGTTGWGSAYYLKRHIVTADRVLPNTFYAYGALGLYRTSDGGVTWTLSYSGQISAFSGYNASLTSVPGKSGHLFFTSGHQSGPVPGTTPLMRSKDGGTTWTAVSGTGEIYCFGFGKSVSPGSYPSIYIVGYLNGNFGIYRSDDDAVTWEKMGDYPLGSLDMIVSIDGDKSVHGKFYIGFGGSSFAYYDPK